MGHLRGLLRACIWDSGDPGTALKRVDQLVQALHVAPMATMVYVRAIPPTALGGPWQLQVANAGHPPLLVRYADGTVELCDDVSGLLVGVDGKTERPTVSAEIPAGTTLLAYTDGLIERPGSDLDEGIAELRERLAAAPPDAGPDLLCDVAVSGTLDGRDDVALLAVRFG
jgi:serine phosphatase RsbU (regulator of sigma subunit)